MGIVLDKDNYKLRYRAKFPNPTKPSLYDETIPNNATNLVQSKAKALHTARIVDCLLFADAEHEICDFVLAVIKDTWVCKLR